MARPVSPPLWGTQPYPPRIWGNDVSLWSVASFCKLVRPYPREAMAATENSGQGFVFAKPPLASFPAAIFGELLADQS